MVVVRMLLAACLVATVRSAAAQEAAPVSDPVRVRMLDEVPNYAKLLKEQWSSTVRTENYEREAAHYGLLGDNETPQPITLQESISLALQNNTGLRIQKLSPMAATARIRQAYAQFDPAAFGNAGKNRSNSPIGTLSAFTSGTSTDLINEEVDWNVGVRKELLTGANVSLQWTNARLFSNPTIVNLLDPQYVTTLGVSLTQPLLRDFGWRFAVLLVDVAQIDEEQAFYSYKAAVADLVAGVEQDYWVYVLAIENVRVDERGLELANELLRQNEGRFKVGALPHTAVLESQAEVARREANLVRSRSLQRIARDNLRALINARQGDANTLLMIEPADKPTVAPVELDLDRSLAVGYKERPELIAARLNADGRKVERKIAENRLLPRFDFVGGVGLNGLGGTGLPGQSFPQPTPGQPPPQGATVFEPNPQTVGSYNKSLDLLTNGRFYQYNFGAVFEIPIANADAKARYAEAKINSENARLSLSQLEENVTLEITQSTNNLKALLKEADATRIARELAEENVHNQQARYDVGLATTKDLIDFQDRLTAAERAEIQALANYNIELAHLYHSDGTLLRERNVMLEHNIREAAPWWAQF